MVENRSGTYFVLVREEAGKDAPDINTRIRSFKVQYTDPELVAALLEKHLSRFGKITTLTGRKLIVAEDLPDFLDRLGGMLAEIDVQPRQILIEAKILEIALDADQTYGIDWTIPFRLEGGAGSFGQQALAPLNLAGLFIEAVTPEFEAFLNALHSNGRVRTLSAPKLLVLENQEAEVVVGDRIGYKVTTTINQVTTESIEFLESGVILKVKAAVDRSGRVLLDVHPEVSTGSVSAGIPSLTTTEVTTQLLADDGQKIFIGGLIKNSDSESRAGVPILRDIPLLGGLFSRTEQRSAATETIVLITPHVLSNERRLVSGSNARQIVAEERELKAKAQYLRRSLPSETSKWKAWLGLDKGVPDDVGEASGPGERDAGP